MERTANQRSPPEPRRPEKAARWRVRRGERGHAPGPSGPRRPVRSGGPERKRQAGSRDERRTTPTGRAGGAQGSPKGRASKAPSMTAGCRWQETTGEPTGGTRGETAAGLRARNRCDTWASKGEGKRGKGCGSSGEPSRRNPRKPWRRAEPSWEEGGGRRGEGGREREAWSAAASAAHPPREPQRTPVTAPSRPRRRRSRGRPRAPRRGDRDGRRQSGGGGGGRGRGSGAGAPPANTPR